MGVSEVIPSNVRVALPLGGTDWGRSGIGTYVHALLPHLHRALLARGGELFAFGNRAELAAYRPSLEGIETVTAPDWANKPAASALWYLTLAAPFAQRHGADLILFPAAQRRCAVRPGLPTVSVVHDLGQLKVADKYDPLRMFYFKQIAMRLIQSSSAKVAISQSTRDDMVKYLGLRQDEIAVVPNGVNYAAFSPMKAGHPQLQAAQRACGLDEPYLLYPARLEHPAKNHLRLLEAFARSRLKETHLLALSGGDWGARPLILDRLQRLGLAGRVRLLGYVPTEHLPGLIAGAEAVLMVGYTEGFGLPALEALASGVSVCAAAAGALPEVVGELAVMCDPFDVASISGALERVALDETLRERCRLQGPAWARRWGWDVTGEKLADVCLATLAA